MRPAQIIQSLAAVALLAIPATAMAAPDQNSGNQSQNRCGYTNSNGQWVQTACNGQNGQWNNGQNQNGQWNNNRNRNRDRDDRRDGDDRNNRDRDDRNGQNGQWNNGRYNNGGYTNGGYNNGRYGNNGQWNNGRNSNAPLSGSVSSFSPYNLYLSNGTHVQLHNGTIINPTGANLTPGTRVRVIGNWNADGTYNANEIDVTNANRYQR